MNSSFKRFTNKNILFNISISIIYLLWCFLAMKGIKNEHVFLVVLWLFAYYTNQNTRSFIKAFSFFIIFWILYDSMRIVPNYTISAVHIREPYEFEKFLFGIADLGKTLTPNEYFLAYNNKFLDFLSGFFYINWMPVPLGFGIYLYLKDKFLFIKYAAVFLLVNIVGFIIYYIYPAAPPWYVQQYAFDLHIGVPGSRAGLVRFDTLIGVPIFENIYNKNANVLAALPSLHAAYPVVVLFFALKHKMKPLIIGLFVLFMFGIWFSAVYTSHHYIIDVIMGVITAIVVLFFFDKYTNKASVNKRIKDYFLISDNQ